MNKRSNQSVSKQTKKNRLEDIGVFKKVCIRNDEDHHIYGNIDCNYVKIGNYVYKVKTHDDHALQISESERKNCILLTLTQYNDINEYIHESQILVSSFHVPVQSINKLTVTLSSDSNFKIITKYQEIAEYIVNILNDHVVSIGQNFNMQYQGISIKIQIDNLDNTTIGKVKKSTEVDFKFFDSNIIICNQCISVPSKLVKVNIIKCVDVNVPTDTDNAMMYENSHATRFPIIINKKIIDSYVRNSLIENFADNDIVTYVQNNFEFTFSIKINNANKQTKYKNIYELKNDTHVMNISSDIVNVILVDDTVTAEKICFNVRPAAAQKYKIDDYILVTSEMADYVKNHIKSLVLDQTFKCPIKSKEVALAVNYINPRASGEIMYEYETVPDTKIVFNLDKNSKFILVQNQTPIEIKKIVFRLKKIEETGLFAMLMGESSDKQKMFDSKKLEKIVRNEFPKKTAVNQSKKITYQGDDCILVVRSIIFNNNEEEIKGKKKILTCGFISINTQITFETSRKNKTFTINDTSKSLSTQIMKNPIEELEKHVGGISEELKIVVRTICLSRGKLKKEFDIRGLKAPKGIIFHGQPGTGKTTLARNLGKILGCEGERFRLMSGPEVFNKWVGSSEANVRDIFKPAKEAWKKFGQEAPVYMVAIDEIDAMLPARSGSSGNPVRDSVVNQFLAEMDGLEQFDNIICIGITNRLELLDPAAIRAGRFGVHVKIDLPDKNGRIKIFDIHTKKLRDGKRLINVDFVKLSELTDKFSGADIESVVGIASSYSLERLSELDVIDEAASNKFGKVTQDDFLRAVKEVRDIGKNPDEDRKLHHMYI